MNSGIYDCRVMHERIAPRRHRFEYRIFMLSIDLDELPKLQSRLNFLSINDQNLLSFHEKDYLPLSDSTRAPEPRTLKDRVTAFLGAQGLHAPIRVQLLTMPRLLGYSFNPVSFYFCFDASGSPYASVVEVTNTFGEMKPYLLGPDQLRPAQGKQGAHFHLRTPKFFYVSPFSDVDVHFDFKLPLPGEALRLHIDDYTGTERTLLSRLYGARKDLTDWNLLRFCVTFPLMTLAVITRIHWHALLLWFKGLPWFPKAARLSDQRGLYRPHAS